MSDATVLSLSAAEVGEVKDNLDAFVLAMPALGWKAVTNVSRQITYSGSFPSPYNSNGIRLDVVVPLTSGEDHSYTQTKFYLRTSNNVSLPLPDPDAPTRVAMTSITEVIAWLGGFVACMYD
jgi:hypothetical protein